MTQPTQLDERQGSGDRRRQAPGFHPVGLQGIIGTGAYLTVLASILMYLLVAIWPLPEPKIGAFSKTDSTTLAAAQAYWSCDPGTVARWKSDSTVRDPKCVTIARRSFPMWDEQRILVLVVFAGALGALLHALRSLSVYVGTRKFKQSWLLMYLVLPITGSLIAVVFYAVIRGGFFAPGAGAAATSPYAFAATAFIVGLFSQVAAEKLKIVAESLFTKGPTTTDSYSDSETATVLQRAQRVASKDGGQKDAIEIEGSGFTEETRLEVNGHERQPELRGPTRLRLILDAAELAALENGGELSVQLKNGDKNSKPALTVS